MRVIDDERYGGDPPCWAHLFVDEPAPPIRVRRVYEPPTPEDGRRVLVDRLWPRGLSKEAARIDTWIRDIAPGDELRRWFGHDPARWEEFVRRYRRELEARPDALRLLIEAATAGPVTLVYGARDERHNQAVVLQQILEERLATDPVRVEDPGEQRTAQDQRPARR